MSLRTRIAVTFLALLAAVLAAALGAVSVTNTRSAEREVQRQLSVGTLVFSRLIDNSVVVLENIYRHMELGATPREAAERGPLPCPEQDAGQFAGLVEDGAAGVALASLDV